MSKLYRSPEIPPAQIDGPSIFLGGSIEMGRAELWQPRVAPLFLDAGISVLDPRRDDWDPNLTQDPAVGSVFERQVSWELENIIDRVDLVFFRICGGETTAIISMLEMGITLEMRKPIVIQADPDYMRYGNIVITARKYNVPVFNDVDAAVAQALDVMCNDAPWRVSA